MYLVILTAASSGVNASNRDSASALAAAVAASAAAVAAARAPSGVEDKSEAATQENTK